MTGDNDFFAILGSYQSPGEGAAWLAARSSRADALRRQFEETYSTKPQTAFADCMMVISRVIQASENGTGFATGQALTAMAILGHAYQLLISAWAELEEGRQAASADHVRSIFEAPAFFLAVWWNADFAAEWIDTTRAQQVPWKNALAITRTELNTYKPGFGDAYASTSRAEIKELQKFSHVGPVSAATLFRQHGNGSSVDRVGADGLRLGQDLRKARFLIRLACNFAAVLGVSVDDLMPIEWHTEQQQVIDQVREYLKQITQVIDASEPNAPAAT